MKRPIYLDNHSTTPLDPRVLDAMLPYLTERFGNPHATDHAYGRGAEEAVEKARAEVAGAIGAEPREIVFTSGATEANNLAILGTVRFARTHGGARDGVVTVATEHKCVLESCRALADEGARLTVVPVEPSGLVDPDRIAAAVDERTALVSVMTVNNEIGVIQPVAEIAKLCRANGAKFHTDCAQALGRVPLDVGAMGADLMSLSGHKAYGPKGIGALYVRRRPRARLTPLVFGGGQERGLRAGTVPTPLVVGLGAAAALARREREPETARLHRLRQRLWSGVSAALDGVHLNGDGDRRVAANLNLAFAGVDGRRLLEELTPEIAVSAGSACSTAEAEPSHVLRAIGCPDALARSSFRIGIGRFTTEAEIDRAIDVIVATVPRLRAELVAGRSTRVA